MSPSTDLTIIVVIYRDYRSVDDLLHAQLPLDPRLRFVLVDNTEHQFVDRRRHAAWAELQGVQVLVAEPENLGYLGAAHFAAAQIPDIGSSAFVAISNSDLMYDAASIAQTLQQRSPERRLGVLAPRLVGDRGEDMLQLHYRARPRARKYQRLAAIFSIYPLAVAHRLTSDWLTRSRAAVQPVTAPDELFAPHGAFMIFTREYVALPGAFASPAFLFCEEVFVGLQCERAGLTARFEPGITYSHRRHGSMGSVPSRAVIRRLRDAHRVMVPLLKDQAPGE